MSDDSVCLATAKEEVAKLQQFSRTLLPGSWVHVKVVEILKSLNDRIKEIERSSTDSSSIQLKVKVPNQSSNLIMSRLALELTLGQLKNLIQETMDTPLNVVGITCDRLQKTWDLKSDFMLCLSSCQLRQGDLLAVQTHSLPSASTHHRSKYVIHDVKPLGSTGVTTSSMITGGADMEVDEVTNGVSSGVTGTPPDTHPALVSYEQRLETHHISASTISTPEYAVVGLAHSMLMDRSLVCMVEEAGGVPGFAPSLRALPASQFLPTNWRTSIDQKANKTKSSMITSLLYKESSVSKKNDLFMLQVSHDGETAMVHIMFKPKSAKSPVQNTDINTVKVKLSDATHSLVDNRTVYYRPTKELAEQLAGIIKQCMPTVSPCYAEGSAHGPSKADTGAVPAAPTHTPHTPIFSSNPFLPPSIPTTTSMPASQPSSQRPAPSVPSRITSMQPNYPLSPAMQQGGYGIGAADLAPAGFPDTSQRFGVPSAGSGSSGMLMGPDHAMFGGAGDPYGAAGAVGCPSFGLDVPGQQRHDPGLHNLRAVHPRFDTLVPPNAVGPHGPLAIGPEGLGVDPNGQRKYPKAPVLPGEPNPDHLKPPSF